MRRRFLPAAAPLLLAALACQDAPTSPDAAAAVSPKMSASAASGLTFRQVSAGGNHSCGVTVDNLAYCWGYNEYGQLGTGSDTGPEQCEGAVGPFACSTRPVLVAGGHHFRQVSAGAFHSCGVTTDDRPFCWGANDGRLGNGKMAGSASPVPVSGGRLFRQIEAGYYHTCGATLGNRAFCWGSNSFGQLGDGTTTLRLSPVAVAGGHSFRHVSASMGLQDFTCGITTENRAFCWGNNRSGQIGDSSTANRRIRPTLVSGGRFYRQVDAGDSHACGVTTANKAFCWGNGRHGELGNGKTYLSRWPRAVSGGLAFAHVYAGQVHSCGITTDDRAYCWGQNGRGQGGYGNQDQSLTPVAVFGGLQFMQLVAGDLHTCGTAADGRGFCWGYGFFGQLGDGSQGEAHSPAPVIGPS